MTWRHDPTWVFVCCQIGLNLTIHLDKNVMLCQILCDPKIVCDGLNSDEYTDFNME